MTQDIEKIISEMAAKDAKVLCREVMSITDTMDVLRNKWTVEILTAILCGCTRFKDIQADLHGISEKVLTERLRQMLADWLIEKQECYGYPPRAASPSRAQSMRWLVWFTQESGWLRSGCSPRRWLAH